MRELFPNLLLFAFKFPVVFQGQAGKNDPARILFKTRIFMFFPARFRFDRSGRVANARCRTQDHRQTPPLGEAECFLHHPVRLLGRGRIEHGQVGEFGKMPRILLCLRRNRPRIIRGKYDEASLHAKIGKAHQRIRGHIEPHLLHHHQYARACEAGAPANLHRRLFVGRPLHMDIPRIMFRNRFQHFRRRRARISAHKIDPRTDRAERDCFVPHQ